MSFDAASMTCTSCRNEGCCDCHHLMDLIAEVILRKESGRCIICGTPRLDRCDICIEDPERVLRFTTDYILARQTLMQQLAPAAFQSPEAMGAFLDNLQSLMQITVLKTMVEESRKS